MTKEQYGFEIEKIEAAHLARVEELDLSNPDDAQAFLTSLELVAQEIDFLWEVYNTTDETLLSEEV